MTSGRPDIDLLVPGEPRGKARPRFDRATGRVFTPTASMRAEHRIQVEWISIGRPTVEGPLSLEIDIVLRRPQNHYKSDGGLSAAGARSVRPTKRPDWDNVAKLVADALNGMAYHDDAQIVEAHTSKRWANRDEQEHTRIRVYELERQVAALSDF